MNDQFVQNLELFLISVVFSMALTFAFIELPRLLDDLLQKNVGFPGFITMNSGWDWAGALVLFLPVFGQFAFLE